jgi:hypothetical protein
MSVEFLSQHGSATLTYLGTPAQAINTTVTLIHICQNVRFTFSFVENSYLSIVQVSTSGVSIVAFWYIQRHWKIDSMKMARLLAFYSLSQKDFGH